MLSDQVAEGALSGELDHLVAIMTLRLLQNKGEDDSEASVVSCSKR